MKLVEDNRSILYYNKFEYKCAVILPGAYLLSKATTINEFKHRFDRINEIRKHTRRPSFIELDSKDFDKAEKIIEIIKTFKKDDNGNVRIQGRKITFYSNDIDLIKKIMPIVDGDKVYHAIPYPQNTIMFKKDPPANFRVFFKNTKASSETLDELIDYIDKTDTVSASRGLAKYINRCANVNRSAGWFFHSNDFINYNDPGQLTMMCLKFPELIGKSYKLEKY